MVCQYTRFISKHDQNCMQMSQLAGILDSSIPGLSKSPYHILLPPTIPTPNFGPSLLTAALFSPDTEEQLLEVHVEVKWSKIYVPVRYIELSMVRYQFIYMPDREIYSRLIVCLFCHGTFLNHFVLVFSTSRL